jgi:hypothetical protein
LANLGTCAVADSDYTVDTGGYEADQQILMKPGRRAWPCVFVRYANVTRPPGEEMPHDVGVDALGKDDVWPKGGHAQGACAPGGQAGAGEKHSPSPHLRACPRRGLQFRCHKHAAAAGVG